MADRAHSTSRRALLAGLSATPLASLPVVALTAHPDAAILALEPDLARLQKGDRDTYDVECVYEDRAHALARSRLGGAMAHLNEGWVDALHAAKSEVGFYEVEAIHLEAVEALRDVIGQVVEIRATTLDGLVVKALYGENFDDVEESIIEDLLAIGASRRASA